MSVPRPTLSRRKLLQVGSALGAAAVAGPLVAGCGGGGGGGSTGGSGSATLRFMFWGSDDRVRRFQEACAKFTEKNPDIIVKPEFGEIDAIRTKTTVGMAGKNLPDVFWVLGDLLPQLGNDGHLMDLGPHLGATDGIDSEGFTESVLAPGKVEGTQYAMVHGLQSIGLFANRRVLEEVGIPVKLYPDSYSWEEYAKYCAQIHAAKGPKFYGTDNPNYAGAGNFFRAYARQNGQDLWSSTGDVGFTKDLLTEWLTYWQRLQESQATVPVALALEQDPFFEGAPMIRGLAAYHMRNSNQMLELQGLSKDPLVLMPAPGNGGAGNSSIALDPNMLGIAATTKFPEAAVKFVNYLLTDEDRAKIIGTTIGAPPTEKIREVVAPTVTEPEQQFLTYVGFETDADSKPVPTARPTAGAFQSGMTKAFETLAYDKATIPETVDLIFGDLRNKLLAS
jgi:multiple sugar transport system substrate-binding protein